MQISNSVKIKNDTPNNQSIKQTTCKNNDKKIEL